MRSLPNLFKETHAVWRRWAAAGAADVMVSEPQSNRAGEAGVASGVSKYVRCWYPSIPETQRWSGRGLLDELADALGVPVSELPTARTECNRFYTACRRSPPLRRASHGCHRLAGAGELNAI